ncbi:MAG: hypothetical protein COT73_03730 [Bdellovibrio sp. CG10_big_fil_rev_8_21_14_0_10_47_8]|nr:MAG: hypothetical protein COT73_03730 [Bdellovibrio sp. CG10_big_fil_rev_8_21_14_0_10_47_8]
MAGNKAKPKATEKKVRRAKPAIEFKPMSFKDFTIKQKNSGRFEVLNSKGKNINGEEKVKLLLDAKVLKGSFKKASTEETTTA